MALTVYTRDRDGKRCFADSVPTGETARNDFETDFGDTLYAGRYVVVIPEEKGHGCETFMIDPANFSAQFTAV